MALFKKHKTEPVPPEDTGAHDTSVGTAADVEAVMKKYDRESNTRVWEGLPKLVIRWLMVAFSAYCIIDTVFLSTRQEVRLPMFVGLILLFGFLTFPAKKGDERVNHMPWYDIVLLIAGPGAYFFYAVNAQNVVQMSARVMQNDLYMIIGLIGILALVELCRRCVGLPILCVAGAVMKKVSTSSESNDYGIIRVHSCSIHILHKVITPPNLIFNCYPFYTASSHSSTS